MRIEEGSGPIDELLKKQTKKGFTPLKFFLLAVLVIILNGILQVLPDFPMKMGFSYFLGIVILGCIITAIVTLKKAGSAYGKLATSLTNEPITGEEAIDLYEITDEGIYINYFNQTTKKQMLFIRWGSIQEMTLGEMKYLYTESSSDSMKTERFRSNIKKEFNQAEDQLGYFPYEPQLSYSDVQAVFLMMDNQRYSELPIPPSWYENGVDERFIEVLKDRLEH